MKWHPHLYIGESLRGREAFFREAVENGSAPGKLWILTLAANGTDLLDLRPARALSREGFREKAPTIVGLSSGRAEAVALVERIARDCFQARGDADLRAFFLSHQDISPNFPCDKLERGDQET